LFDSYFSRNRYDSADCTFANLYIWRHVNAYEWAPVGGYLSVKGRLSGQPFVLPPLGDMKPELSVAVLALDNYFANQGFPLFIKGATIDVVNFLARTWPNKFIFSPDRNSYEYVYRSSDLINLSGNNYRAKRNHINYFKRLHPDYKFVPLTHEMIPESLAVFRSWYRTGSRERTVASSTEESAIEEALQHWVDLQLAGGAILINDRVEAFSLGEELNEDTFVVHIEKANPCIKGLYQAINRDFCRIYCAGKKYVNREEDLGIAGIRAAKISYRPVGYVPKINAIARTKLQ
jgi:hypothetical protein